MCIVRAAKYTIGKNRSNWPYIYENSTLTRTLLKGWQNGLNRIRAAISINKLTAKCFVSLANLIVSSLPHGESGCRYTMVYVFTMALKSRKSRTQIFYCFVFLWIFFFCTGILMYFNMTNLVKYRMKDKLPVNYVLKLDIDRYWEIGINMSSKKTFLLGQQNWNRIITKSNINIANNKKNAQIINYN